MIQFDEILNGLISDIMESKIPLSQSLLKAKVVAYSMQNEKFKSWIDSELNGYVGQNYVPLYRIIPTASTADLIQDLGLGNYRSQNDYFLPLEQIDDNKIIEYLIKTQLHINIAELEALIEQGKNLELPIPMIIYSKFKFINGWEIHSARQKINITTIKGVINKIKSHLLEFLLEIKQEFGQINNLNFMENKDKINQLFDKTIGKIEGTNITISFGDNSDSLSVVNQGDNSNLNVIKGDNNTQKSDNQVKLSELKGFIELLSKNIENLQLSEDDKCDINAEIQRVDNQINRENPKYDIIATALKTIKDIMINIPANIVANLATPSILEQLTMLSDFFIS